MLRDLIDTVWLGHLGVSVGTFLSLIEVIVFAALLRKETPYLTLVSPFHQCTLLFLLLLFDLYLM